MSILDLFGQNKKAEFRFKEPESKACFTCDHILKGERPILFVSHDANGDWQFMCGQNDHTDKNAKLISLVQATELDPTVNDLYEMPMDFGADRKSVKDKWEPFRLPAE